MEQKYRDDKISPRASLKEALTTAIIEAARIGGWEKLDRPALVEAFRDRAGRSTVFRYIAALHGSPLDRTTAEILRDGRRGSPAQKESVAREIRARAAAALPAAPSIDQVAGAVVPIAVMEKLGLCLAAATDVMEKSRGMDGSVRNSKMLLAAAEQLRRNLDTAVKLQEAINDDVAIERFHRIIVEEIEKIDPAVGRRIVARLGDIEAAWGSNRQNPERNSK